VSEFRFAEPEWVHVIWGVLAFGALLVALDRRGGDAVARLVGRTLAARLVHGPSSARRLARIALLTLAGVFMVLALMRPQWGLRHVATPRVGAEIMIALDVSRSMLAEDVAPNRLERAKAEIVDLLGYLDGDQVGLIVFAGRASVLSPLTPDFGFLRLVLEGAGPASVTRGGTRLEEPIRKAVAGFGPASGASRAVLLITDGEDHDSFPLDAARAAAEAGVVVVTIGFGDEAGSEIVVRDPRTQARGPLRDADGVPVRSRLDGDLLREIALATGGAYVPAGTGVLDLESIYREHVAGLTRADLDPRGRTVRDEAYAWCVLAALVLIVASVGVASGPVMTAPLALAVVLATGSPVRAEGGQPTAAPDPSRKEPATEASGAPEAPPTPETAPETPRAEYNRGFSALETGDLDEAERWLARSRAASGDDDELRYRATYDLGYVAVQRAGRLEAEAPEAALESLHRGADWFREAVTLRPDDEDARVNLEVALRRALLLADTIARADEGDLARKLEVIAERQRGIAGEAARLHHAERADPGLALDDERRRAWRGTATSQRTLLGDADALAARVGDERDGLAARDEDERTPEDAMREAQLDGVLQHLHRARERMGQTRRQLRRRSGERAYRRAAAALRDVGRALDQLHDPVQVLDALLRDASETAQQARLLEAAGRLPADSDAPIPAWLSNEAVVESWSSAVERCDELHARLRAGLDHAPETGEVQSLLVQVAEAEPFVARACGRARAAGVALEEGRVGDAVSLQLEALEALAAARERFLDLRGLIEAAWTDQNRIEQALLSQESDVLRELVEPLRRTQERNLDRSDRLEARIASEREKLAEPRPDDPSQPVADPDAPQRERLAAAAQWMPLIRGAMRDTRDALGAQAAGDPRLSAAREAATAARSHLDTLRRLFFTIVEQVRDVAQRQVELGDATDEATALGAQDAEPLAPRQRDLADRSLDLANALEAGSSEAAAAEEPQARESAERLRAAGEHVLAAETAMRGAQEKLASEPAAYQDARVDQQQALEALGEALALLEPPGEQGDPGDEGGGRDASGSSDAGAPEEAEAARADPSQLLQGVRDREAQRQRDRARRATIGEETVEKDW
jgi:Ca-activated chloride channel family protein